MNKYKSPIIEIENLEPSDVITASVGTAVKLGSLEGVDREGEKSAIFDANFWINLVG